jgi:hypothetical protein
MWRIGQRYKDKPQNFEINQNATNQGQIYHDRNANLRNGQLPLNYLSL